MLLAYRVVGSAHIEQHAAILKHCGCGMVCQISFNAFGQPCGLWSLNAGSHARAYQPCRARRFVMCAVWWRECQS